MATVKRSKLDKKILKSLEPLGSLSLDKLDELASKSTLDEIPAGRTLFRQGEKDKRVIYLLSGQIELAVTGNPRTEIIKAKTGEAKHPISPDLPRTSTAKTKTACTLLFIDKDLLEILQDEESSGLIEVEELSSDDESAWMLRFLQSRAFLKLPTENIQNLLLKLEEVPFRKGETVIQQGDNNDYYYIIQKGRCAVSRRPAPQAQEVQLAILKVGDGFGEEALITGGKRNATITMLEDGILMRLGKKDFMSLLADPLIIQIDKETTLQKVESGSLLIDVRVHEEFMQQRVEGSVNIPLSMLRLKLEGLNPERDYILICNDGNLSAAAAFLLTQHGLNCFVLEGGLKKNKLKLPDANLAVKIQTPAENRKTIAAEKTKQAAEAKAAKIRKEAESTKHEARELAKRAASAEAAKRKAEAEIKRLQEEEVSKRESALKAAKQRLNEESKRAKSAEEKAARLKLEAKAAKRKAEEELEKLRAKTQANTQRQAALDNALQQAKTIAADAAKAAEKARRQAEEEARQIRLQAEEEARRLRQEMEETLQRMEKEAEQAQAKQTLAHQAELDKTRQQAISEAERIRLEAKKEAEKLRADMEAARQAAKQEATQLAEQEAERIRLEALQEAEKLRADMEAARQAAKQEAAQLAEQEAERIRLEALQEAEKLRTDIEAARQAARREAAQLAEQEAERIRLEALQEAEKLRAEMKAAKEEAQEIAAEVVAQEQRQKYLLQEARRQAEEIARARTIEAEQEAESIRSQAAIEAARLRDEIHATRQLLAEQVAQARAEAEAQGKSQRAAKQRQHQAAEEKKRKQAIGKNKAEEMRRKAEAIKARLEKAEQSRQEEEAKQQAKGMSLANATVRRVKNRIILEGAEDIFIFKEPTIKPEDLVKEESVEEIIQEEDELPSFTVDTPEEAEYVPVSKTEISETFNKHLENTSSRKKQHKRRAFAIAATIATTALLGASLFVFQQDGKIPGLDSNTTVQQKHKATISKPATTTPFTSLEKKNQENKLKQQAKERFNQLLKKWNMQIKVPGLDQQPAGETEPPAEAPPTSEADSNTATAQAEDTADVAILEKEESIAVVTTAPSEAEESSLNEAATDTEQTAGTTPAAE